MFRVRTILALSSSALALAMAPAALGQSATVGSSAGSPSANICALSFDCTYVNYQHGKPADVIRHSGKLRHWTLNAGSVGGQVQLRVLRPVAHGRLKFVASSATETVTSPGENTFATHIKVRAGDVLALTNASSGLYMGTASSARSVRYFSSAVADGWSGKPDMSAPGLRVLLSASVSH